MVGALRQETVIENGRKTSAVLEKNITIDTYSEFEYLQKFKELKRKGILVNCEFADNVWNIKEELKDVVHHPSFFDGNNVPLKYYSILLLENNSSANVAKAVRFISQIILVTDGLTEDWELKDGQYNVTPHMISLVQGYFDYVGIEKRVARQYIEPLKEICDYSSQCRKLPILESLIKFNLIIEGFEKEMTNKDFRFLPVVLWWKLTMVIPMRPVEFYTIKRESIYTSDGKYYIRVNRSKKSDPDDEKKHVVPLISEFEISKELYDLFLRYIEKYIPGEEDYLFNVNTMARTSVRNKRDFVGRSLYDSLLNSFFDEIVIQRFGYTVVEKEKKQTLEENEIEFINYGDTRHFAFLNLILSGYNPYDIAQLGGHRNLSEQMSYYGGAKPFCSSYAYVLATGIVDKLPRDISFGQQRMIEHRKSLLLDKADARKLNKGYCLSKNFPFECVGIDCAKGKCEYFRHDNDEDIERDMEEVEKDIEKNVSFLKSIVYTEPMDSISRQETVADTNEKIVQLSRLIRERRG
ncbi:MAG: hypothetical protein K6E64_03810 [Lachnospiraceae bacterium]|nr:hypothetical protein [Lachnospiraceae bacterium]